MSLVTPCPARGVLRAAPCSASSGMTALAPTSVCARVGMPSMLCAVGSPLVGLMDATGRGGDRGDTHPSYNFLMRADERQH